MLATFLNDDVTLTPSTTSSKTKKGKSGKGTSFADLLTQSLPLTQTKSSTLSTTSLQTPLEKSLKDEKKENKKELKTEDLLKKYTTTNTTEDTTNLQTLSSFLHSNFLTNPLPEKTIVVLRQAQNALKSSSQENLSRSIQELSQSKDLETLLKKADALGLKVIKTEVTQLEASLEPKQTPTSLSPTLKTQSDVLKIILAKKEEKINEQLPTTLENILLKTSITEKTATVETLITNSPLSLQNLLTTLEEKAHDKKITLPKGGIKQEDSVKTPSLLADKVSSENSLSSNQTPLLPSLTSKILQELPKEDTTKFPKNEPSLLGQLFGHEETKTSSSFISGFSSLFETGSDKKEKSSSTLTLNYDQALPIFNKDENLVKYRTLSAKESLSYFSDNIKEQIDNFRPPMMKVSLEIRPENLGNLEVTLVSRGNALQINVNSNNSALQLLSANIIELKNNLVSMGYGEAQMSFNFSQNGQGGQSQSQQQHNPQQERQRQLYESHQNDNETLNSSQLESLSIIFPRYA